MKSDQPAPVTIDEYIAGYPPDVQAIMEQIRTTIKKVAPDVGEKISYGMPTFTLNGTYLVYFAGFKKHIGFYPAPIGIAEFKEELSPYKTGKGSVQFPLDGPIPFDLIEKITSFRLKENLEKAEAKRTKK
jgi:uncharacterized protein YdhG (YjbR/CyaY superfamily)